MEPSLSYKFIINDFVNFLSLPCSSCACNLCKTEADDSVLRICTEVSACPAVPTEFTVRGLDFGRGFVRHDPHKAGVIVSAEAFPQGGLLNSAELRSSHVVECF